LRPKRLFLKVDFVKSVYKTDFGELSFPNFSPLQLISADKLLHWVVVKIIMCKQHNYGRIDDFYLSVMWLLKNKIKVNWPLFFSNYMISYKNECRKRLPYPSFISCLLKFNRVPSVNTLLTTPSDSSGLDEKAIQTMHYVKDSKGNSYYDDKLSPGTWYYDFITMPEGTDLELVKQMKENIEKEDHNLENDAEIEDVGEETSEDADFDYDPDNDHSQDYNQNHLMVDLSKVLNEIMDIKRFMTQKFDPHDL